MFLSKLLLVERDVEEYLYKIGDKLKNSSHSIDSVTFPFLFLYLKFNLSRKLICRKRDLNILRIIYQLEILTF